MTDFASDDDDYEEPCEFSCLKKKSAKHSANPVAAPGEATCALNMERVIISAKRLLDLFPGTTWIQQVIDLLDPAAWPAEKGPQGWCGWPNEPSARLTTSPIYAESIKTLMTPNSRKKQMIREARPSSDYGIGTHRCYMRYFQVPKELDPPEDRGIGDARPLNSRLKSVGGMQLAKIVQIFSMLREFPGGHAYIGDLKSWFNQISIPEGIKALFSLALGTNDFEYNTLVMGGQPSAKLAHGISCIWIICAALDLGFTVDDVGAAAPPPVIRISKEGSSQAAAVPWIDNWLVVAQSKSIRDNMAKAMSIYCDATHSWGIMIKDGSELRQPISSPFDFLGLRLCHDGRVVRWRHITSNLTEWAKLSRITPGVPVKARAAARITGIGSWDFSVKRGASGEALTLGHAAQIFDLAADLGKDRSVAADWNKLWMPRDMDATTLNDVLSQVTRGLPENHIALSKDELDALLDRSMLPTIPPLPRPAKSVCSASDASKLRGGHVVFDEARVLHWEAVEFMSLAFYECDRTTHINKLETAVAIFSLNKVMDTVTEPTEIRHAIDNSTARSALRLGRYPKDPKLTAQLQALRKRINRVGCCLTVLQVPTGDMVADGPSRASKLGQPIAPTDEQAKQCFKSMTRADCTRYMCLRTNTLASPRGHQF